MRTMSSELTLTLGGSETISVPLPLLIALRDAWDTYRSADGSVSLGESFHIEGKGQGKSKMKGGSSSASKNTVSQTPLRLPISHQAMQVRNLTPSH